MFCTHCGTQVADTDKFCPECGAPIERPAETTLSSSPDGEAASPYTGEAATAGGVVPDAPHTAAYTAPAPAYTPAPAPKKKSHKALWITLTCVALAAVIAVALIVWHPWSKNDAKENPLSDVTGAPVATEKPAAELAPEEAIRAAFEKLSEADSLHVDFVEDISLSIGVSTVDYTQDMDVSVVLSCDSDKTNGSSRIEGSMSLMGYEQNVLTYAETVDGKVMTYTSTDGGKTWSLNGNDTISDPTAAIDLWMKHAKNFEKTGTEQINGFGTTVYTGSLSGEFIKDAMGMTGEMFGAVDEATLNNLDDLSLTVWVDNGSGRVVRMVLDMQDVMKTLLENVMQQSMGELPEGMEFSIDVRSAQVICDMSRFNEIPPIVIPDEARGNGTTPEPEPEAESIVGTWTLCGGEDEETQQYADLMLSLGMEMVFVFNEDGTGSMSMTFQGEEDKEEFTYTLENGEIVINGKGAPYRIEDGLLHLTADDVKLIFKRK